MCVQLAHHFCGHRVKPGYYTFIISPEFFLLTCAAAHFSDGTVDIVAVRRGYADLCRAGVSGTAVGSILLCYEPFSRLQVMTLLWKIRRGEHIYEPGVEHIRVGVDFLKYLVYVIRERA